VREVNDDVEGLQTACVAVQMRTSDSAMLTPAPDPSTDSHPPLIFSRVMTAVSRGIAAMKVSS
jgi:hypothetical protein